MKKKRIHLSKPLFLIIFIVFIAALVFTVLFTYNKTWTYEDYKIKRIYDDKNECLDYHTEEYCLDKDKVILEDSK